MRLDTAVPPISKIREPYQGYLPISGTTKTAYVLTVKAQGIAFMIPMEMVSAIIINQILPLEIPGAVMLTICMEPDITVNRITITITGDIMRAMATDTGNQKRGVGYAQ